MTWSPAQRSDGKQYMAFQRMQTTTRQKADNKKEEDVQMTRQLAAPCCVTDDSLSVNKTQDTWP